MSTFTISRHAVERALDMGLEGDEIREAFLNPRHISNAGTEREFRTRGKITVVVAKAAPPVVVTVMWATADAWQTDHDSIQSRGGERHHEHVTNLRRAKKAQKRKTRGRGYAR